MVWKIDGAQGYESDKICCLIVPYAQGRGLDIGCGQRKAWHRMIGIDNLTDYGGNRPPSVDVISDGNKLPMFSDKSMDFVFSSHFLEHVVDTKACLQEWWRVLKPGGNLILYLPHKNFYPNIGQEGSNRDHKHDFLPTDIIAIMKEVGSWELLENEDRDKGNEYSFFQCFRRLTDKEISEEKYKESKANRKKSA